MSRGSAIVMVLAVMLGAAVLPEPAAADPREDMRRIEQELDEAAQVLAQADQRVRELSARLVDARRKLSAAKARVDEVRGEVLAARVRVRTSTSDAPTVQRTLAEVGRRYGASVRAVDQARDRVDTMLGAAFKGGLAASVTMVLEARDPTEVLDRLARLRHLATTGQAAVHELHAAELRARAVRSQARVARQRSELSRHASATLLARAEVHKSVVAGAVTMARSSVAATEDALDAAKDARKKSQKRYDEIRKEADRVAQRLAVWERARWAKASGARFLMPTQGWKSSDFGNRFDPVYKRWQLHAGVDIAAKSGSPIYAAADGEVVQAGRNGGYGNYTCLDHGRYKDQDLSTCYGHQSRIVVDEGDSVKQGELIGRVGSTGASTGPHLHFEVRLDGDPTDPLPFLPRCLC